MTLEVLTVPAGASDALHTVADLPACLPVVFLLLAGVCALDAVGIPQPVMRVKFWEAWSVRSSLKSGW